MSAADEQPESTAAPTRSEDSAEGGDLGHETSRAEVGHVLEFLEDGNARQAQTAWNEAKKKLLKTDDLGGMRVLLAELSAAQVPEKTRRLHGELLYSTQQNVRFLERKAGIQPSAPLVLAARAASTPMRATTVSHELDDKEELAFKVDSLARALAERRKRLEATTRQFEAARKAHSQRVSAARKARDATRMGRKLAGGSIWSSGQLSKVALYEGTIVTPDGTHALTSDVRATVDTAGNLMVTRRHTLTRAALLGPFSLFAPKSVTHGENEVYLLIESDNFASVVQCRPEQGAHARELAVAINLAAKRVDSIRARREKEIAEAEEAVSIAEADRAQIEEVSKAEAAIRADTADISKLFAETTHCFEHAAPGRLLERKAKKVIIRAEAEVERAQAPELAERERRALPPGPPEELRQEVLGDLVGLIQARIDLLGDSQSEAQTDDFSGPALRTAPSEALDLIERLGDLHNAGVLTDAEFAGKKADLLRRL